MFQQKIDIDFLENIINNLTITELQRNGQKFPERENKYLVLWQV